MVPLQQRRKTSEQNAFFIQDLYSVGGYQHVKIGLHWFDNDHRVEVNEICYCVLLLPQ